MEREVEWQDRVLSRRMVFESLDWVYFFGCFWFTVARVKITIRVVVRVLYFSRISTRGTTRAASMAWNMARPAEEDKR